MSNSQQKQLGVKLWSISDKMYTFIHQNDFRDYMLSLIFVRSLSYNYETAVKKELGNDYAKCEEEIEKGFTLKTQDYFISKLTPLIVWYVKNSDDVTTFEKQMRKKVHFVIKPCYLWSNIRDLARTQNNQLLKILRKGFESIENEAFNNIFIGLLSMVDLNSCRLGKTYELRNNILCSIINAIEEILADFPNDSDILSDAYEYLINQFSEYYVYKGKGMEFYTPQQISTLISRIVTLDNQDQSTDKEKHFKRVLDFACGSGSLLLSIRKHFGANNIGQIYGQEKDIVPYKIARMNMFLHGLKDSEFQVFCGDSLTNDWNIFSEMNPSKKIECDIVVASLPFSCAWKPNITLEQDFRFESYGLAPKAMADFAFLLHGFHFLSDTGIMAVILTQFALSRGGSEEKIRTKLLIDGNIDAIIGLPSHLFHSTGASVCILVLKKCKKFKDVLFINANDKKYFEKVGLKNILLPECIDKIVETYQHRKEDNKKYSRRVSIKEIKENGFNLNISRYVCNTAE